MANKFALFIYTRNYCTKRGEEEQPMLSTPTFPLHVHPCGAKYIPAHYRRHYNLPSSCVYTYQINACPPLESSSLLVLSTLFGGTNSSLTLVVRQRQQAPHSEDSSLSLLAMLAVVVAVHRVSPTITQSCSQFNAREYYMAIRVGGCGYTVSVVDSSSPYYYYVQIYRHHITIHNQQPHHRSRRRRSFVVLARTEEVLLSEWP